MNKVKTISHHTMAITCKIACRPIFGDREKDNCIVMSCFLHKKEIIIRYSDWKADINKKYSGLSLAFLWEFFPLDSQLTVFSKVVLVLLMQNSILYIAFGIYNLLF